MKTEFVAVDCDRNVVCVRNYYLWAEGYGTVMPATLWLSQPREKKTPKPIKATALSTNVNCTAPADHHQLQYTSLW